MFSLIKMNQVIQCDKSYFYRVGDTVALDPFNFSASWFSKNAKGKTFKIERIENHRDDDGNDFRFYLSGLSGLDKESLITEEDLIPSDLVATIINQAFKNQ